MCVCVRGIIKWLTHALNSTQHLPLSAHVSMNCIRIWRSTIVSVSLSTQLHFESHLIESLNKQSQYIYAPYLPRNGGVLRLHSCTCQSNRELSHCLLFMAICNPSSYSNCWYECLSHSYSFSSLLLFPPLLLLHLTSSPPFSYIQFAGTEVISAPSRLANISK